MRNKIIFIVVIIFIAFIMTILFKKEGTDTLATPQLKTTLAPSLLPSPTPKQFKFDSSTNLKQELETVNPQVLDSDFAELDR